MRIVKRILAGFLAASVLFSSNMICFTAVAEGTNDTNIAMPGSNVTELLIFQNSGQMILMNGRLQLMMQIYFIN